MQEIMDETLRRIFLLAMQCRSTEHLKKLALSKLKNQQQNMPARKKKVLGQNHLPGKVNGPRAIRR